MLYFRWLFSNVDPGQLLTEVLGCVLDQGW